MIDLLYSKEDKNNFYLGLISQVYKNVSVIQVENLSWLKFRKLKEDILIPNTINFLVVVESVKGIFIGEVHQSKIPNTVAIHNALADNRQEKIYPELTIDIIGVLSPEESKFRLSGFDTVGLTDKAYIANRKVISIFLNSIDIKNINEEKLDSFARYANMGSEPVSLKPSTLFDRHLMAIGTTNSGKSTSSLSILDKLAKAGKKILIIDPVGEYSESFIENDRFSRLKLGENTVLDPGRLSFSQWAMLFETNDATQPAILADAIRSLRFQLKTGRNTPYIKEGKSIVDVKRDMASLISSDTSFDISLLPRQITEEAVEANKAMDKYQKGNFQFNQKQWLVQKVEYKLSSTKLSQFFTPLSTENIDLISKIDEFIKDDIHSLYIDASTIGVSDGIGSMIVDLISSYIINTKEKDNIAFVLFIDEVHRYSKSTENGGYQIGLTAIAREGRKKGIFLFLTTQNPQDVPHELLGQVGSLLIHRLTHKNELESIRNYLSEQSYREIKNLNQGEAILTSINLIREIHLQIEKCNRIHHNETTLL
ncbi:ATP-binding protein [Aerococcaceae bacterium NML180378]|nr:ATP-binding protein [Aerococcaceae bacterium NML180378]